MQERNRGVAYLTTPCASRHLQLGFNQMRHGAADAAMAVTQQPAVGVERHLAVAAEISGAYPRCRFAAPGKAKFFQQHRKGDGKAVVDGCVADVRYRNAGGFFRPCDCNLRAEFAQGRSRRDMLMRMRLRAAEHTYPDITGRSRLTTKAAPPSETGQQSSSFSGEATGLEASTSTTVIGSRNCAPGCVEACLRINTANSARSSSVTPYSCM